MRGIAPLRPHCTVGAEKAGRGSCMVGASAAAKGPRQMLKRQQLFVVQIVDEEPFVFLCFCQDKQFTAIGRPVQG